MWLTKEKGYGRRNNWYFLWDSRPTKEVNGKKINYAGFDFIGDFCPQLIERHTNVHLKPGEIREAENITFEFKD